MPETASPNTAPRGRYAPSPTGSLHLGNASTALLAWLSIRARAGSFVIRMEDLDRQRVRAGAADRILEDLEWLGLDWDEGPDRGGPHAPYEQSRRLPSYEAAFEALRESGRAYPCFCSRRDIAEAASAPQAPGEEARYPGTCRALDPEDARRRISEGKQHAWRFCVDEGEAPTFVDLVRGLRAAHDVAGDFVIRRADGVPAYQLAVVVDDAAMGITEVVRGDDLLASTPRQLLLYRALDLEPPAFGHVPLLLGADGIRLSKRHPRSSIRDLRDAGCTAETIVGRLAHLLGLAKDPSAVSGRALVEGFALRRVVSGSDGIVVDPARWE